MATATIDKRKWIESYLSDLRRAPNFYEIDPCAIEQKSFTGLAPDITYYREVRGI